MTSYDDIKRIPASQIQDGDELAVIESIIHQYPATVGQMPGAKYHKVYGARVMLKTGSIGIYYGHYATAFTPDRIVIVRRTS